MKRIFDSGGGFAVILGLMICICAAIIGFNIAASPDGIDSSPGIVQQSYDFELNDTINEQLIIAERIDSSPGNRQIYQTRSATNHFTLNENDNRRLAVDATWERVDVGKSIFPSILHKV